MKTQISRNSFKAVNRYAGVYQQQGRMLTDADWNELVDLLKGHLAEALKDVVGTGSPRTGSLAITDDRQIHPGDVYVNGLRAELPGTDPMDPSNQPDFPGSPNLPEVGPYTVYADVWERSLTTLEDNNLRDAGLNGADTCTRTQTMLQVKTCPGDVDPETDIPQKGDAALTLALHGNLESGDPCDPCAGQVEDGGGRIGNYLFRVEVHAAELSEGNLTGLTIKWSSENGAEQYEAHEESLMPPGFVVSGRYIYEFFDLWSETHLGVHLNPDFDPTIRGLTPTYVIPEVEFVPKAYVRRWDGYCELTYDGSGWSLVKGLDKGVTLSTNVPVTAPGYVSLDSSLSINLEALKLELVLNGSTFVAGDYWLAPVREAEDVPGSIVLDGAPPEGIVHHCQRLARVAADGTVELFDDDADRRRHLFPPLTDLRAFDVGYQTVCSSGLFDATHDNVEKALNRLCELAAEHIHYQADCSQGLFQNFEGTVKDALDKICSIQAGNVFFAKPCDTSVYQGQTVATVEDALKLLCNVTAGQIAYMPGGGCTFLNQPGIDTVQEALDALCLRPAGGGCKVTVGQGGQFDALDEAIKTLLSQKVFDICLCLLPGEHTFGGVWQKEKEFPRFNLTIAGCGAGAKVVLKDALMFIGLTSLKLENFAMNGMAQDFPLTVEGCSEVHISNLHHVGLAKESALMHVSGGERVRLEETILEAYTTIGLEKARKVFGFDSDLAKLYAVPLRDDFLGLAGETAEAWAQLRQNERLKIAGGIQSNLERLQKPPENMNFTLDEEVAYRRLVQTLVLLAVDTQALLDGLREVRDQAHHAAAGRGMIFMDSLAYVALEDNTIFGSVGFYGQPGKNLSDSQIDELSGMLKPPARIRFLSSGASLQAWDNRITRLTVGGSMIDILQELIENPGDEALIQGLYRTALFESNTIAGARNQLLFENITLSANEFQTLVEPVIGWAVGKTAIYTGNRVRQAEYTDLSGKEFSVGGGRVQTAARDQAQAANLPKGSW